MGPCDNVISSLVSKTKSGEVEWQEIPAIGVDDPYGWVSVNDEFTFTLPRMVMVPQLIVTLTRSGQEVLTYEGGGEVRELIYTVRSVCKSGMATADQETRTSVMAFLQGLR